MAELDFGLTYAGVPFLADDARPSRLELEGAVTRPLRKQQPEKTLLEDLDRTFPFEWAKEFGTAQPVLRNTVDLNGPSHAANPPVRIGEWFYPRGAQRWSYFRGLVTSSAVKAMVAATTGGSIPATFAIKCEPSQSGKQGRTYSITTPLFMMPPRPIG